MSPPPQEYSVKELKKAMSGKTLAPVYLLHGEEGYNRDSQIQKMIESTLDPSERDFNLDSRYAPDLSAEALDSLLNTPPLLASRRVVIIRDITAMKKGVRQVLDRYLKSPAAEVLLILVESGALPASEKTLPTICTTVEFPRLERGDIQKWVVQHLGSYGARISPEAAGLLLDVVGPDMSQLAPELDKLVSYSADSMIDVAAVEDLVGVRHGETVGDLLDAIAGRDAGRALDLLGHVLAQSRTNVYSVLLPLSAQMMGLAYARALLDEGESPSRLAKPLFDFLKSGKGAMTGRPWKEAVDSWAAAAGSWTSKELAAACEAVLRTDISIKESGSSSDEQLLTSLILELCVPGKSAPSKR